MRRVPSTELLDDDRGTPTEIRQGLKDLWRINRWLGGFSGTLQLLTRIFERAGIRQARILDVGAGDGRLAMRLGARLHRQGFRAEIFVLDRRLSHLEQGKMEGDTIHAIVGDALRMPFGEGAFHVVLCNLFLHHFSGEKLQALLSSLADAASQAVVVNDLERGWLPYLFIRANPVFARSPLTRHDGPASVRQAYTRQELGELVRAAGFRDFELSKLPFCRLGLTIWKKASRKDS